MKLVRQIEVLSFSFISMFTVMCNFELGLHQKENYLTWKLGAEVVD
jgi:hypothetical protein